MPSKFVKFNRESNPFDTSKEVRAFIEGVTLVNDSALAVVGVRETETGHFEVLMWDEDCQYDLKPQRIKSSSLVTLDF